MLAVKLKRARNKMGYSNNNIFEALETQYSYNCISNLKALAIKEGRLPSKAFMASEQSGYFDSALELKFSYLQKKLNKRRKVTFTEISTEIITEISIEPDEKINKFAKKILIFNKDAPSFLITGCQGGGPSGDQAGVAKEMRKFLNNSPSKENTLGMFLGDNFYNSGVTHEHDPLFNDAFYHMYQGLDIPFFNILGNHDYDFHGGKHAIHPMQRAMAQVNHTYVAKALRGFPDWIMPSRYYALSFKNVNFFMLDSNTFCFDEQQRSWLVDTHKTLNSTNDKKKWNIIVMHHPLVSYGKRHPDTNKSDIDWYWLNEYEHKPYNFLSLPNSSMNQWIFEKLAELNLEFDLELCAHDHFLGFSEITANPYPELKTPYWKSTAVKTEKTMFQALVGGGGGKIPMGLKNKDKAIWTEPHYGFLDLKIGETLDLTYHHWNSRFSFGTNQKKFSIGRDPLLNPNDDTGHLYIHN
jgi:hypothetical protein